MRKSALYELSVNSEHFFHLSLMLIHINNLVNWQLLISDISLPNQLFIFIYQACK